jgi:predicted dehydrogenase
MKAPRTRYPVKSGLVKVALIGAGGMGEGVINILKEFPDVRIVAVADPAACYQDWGYYKRPLGRLPVKQRLEEYYRAKRPNYHCAAYADFREMLDKEDIDAVVCATPDFSHAYISIYCMRHGKHVYCEKPLTHNIREARLVARVARETGLATQMGNLGHARDGMRETCELLWKGAIGIVREVHAWVNTRRWFRDMTEMPTAQEPVPAGLDWDLWLGPRPFRPYNSAFHPVRWRDFWTYGLGSIGDFVCHDLDLACWALKLDGPEYIEAFQAGKNAPELTPHAVICHYNFPRRGPHSPVKVHWYDGGLRPATPDAWPKDRPWPGRGSMFVGDKGILMAPDLGGTPFLLPEKRDKAVKRPAPIIPRSPGHHREWIDACKGGPAPGAHFGYSAKLTELALLGVLAMRMDKPIRWDNKAMKAIDLPEADAIINGEPYREGWEIE